MIGRYQVRSGSVADGLLCAVGRLAESNVSTDPSLG
jgi:hypothetical protein